MGGKGYSVAFDPLDGSSIIDTNFAVGTIWGVWPGDRYCMYAYVSVLVFRDKILSSWVLSDSPGRMSLVAP